MKLPKKSGQAISGFSLIEVLIAVLVLATGMLALAALQSSLVRNSADAKNRSQAMSSAIDVVERVRQSAAKNMTDYNSVVVGTGAWAELPAPPAFGDAKYSTTYESRQIVTRFVRESNAAVCGAGNTPCFREAAAGEAQRPGVAEFKRIDAEVRWTDMNGDVRMVSASDIVGTVTDDKTDLIVDQSGANTTGVGAPVARIDRPSEAGIIPIAFGDSSETAASNPKPVTGRERGRTDETQFQVLTYSLDGDIATLQQVIDTRAIGCRCSLQSASIIYSANSLLTTPVQPTYWTGTAYREPEAVESNTDGLRGIAKAGAVQSELCQTCCLDHHDRDSNAVRLDSWRTHESGGHKHFYDPDESNSNYFEFAEAESGDDYFEACRVIRVNGIFRVATDARLELMNMLEVDPLATTESVPLASAATAYAAAVKDFVDQRIVQGVQDPLLNYPAVFNPPPIRMNGDVSRRFQHNRGLYIDHLETPALEALAEARANCSSGDLVDCMIPFVPVVSINTTEISQWRTRVESEDVASNPSLIDAVAVTNYSLIPGCRRPPCLTPDSPPARGVLSSLVTLGDEFADVSQYRSNSGISDSLPIDRQDAGPDYIGSLTQFPGEKAADARLVQVSDACADKLGEFKVSASGSGAYFTTANLNINWSDPESASTCALISGQVCEATPTASGGPNPRTCSTGFVLPEAPLVVKLSGYNRKVGSVSVDNFCTNRSNDNVDVDQCVNFGVAGVTVNGAAPVGGYSLAPFNDGRTGTGLTTERTELTFDGGARLNQGDRIEVLFDAGVVTTVTLTCDGNRPITACP